MTHSTPLFLPEMRYLATLIRANHIERARNNPFMKSFFLLLLVFLTASCDSQVTENLVEGELDPPQTTIKQQIGEYVVVTFEDSEGNLWFGTLERGVAKYDGQKLSYYTMDDGLPSNRIVDVVEDRSGNLWFGTGAGLSKFDGKSFTNYSEKDGLLSNLVSVLLIDQNQNLWIGTWSGVSRFDGSRFEDFPIPHPEMEKTVNGNTMDWITLIDEDADGNIWFGRDGYGACKYDGEQFVHFTTREGLNSNNVQAFAQDNRGDIWIGTRVAEKDHADPEKRSGPGGLNHYDGERFSHFPEVDGFHEDDVYAIYKDRSGDL